MPEQTSANIATVSIEGESTLQHAWDAPGFWNEGNTVFTSTATAPCVWGLVVSCQVDWQACTWEVVDGTITLTVI
jgi:hypothetical protein